MTKSQLNVLHSESQQNVLHTEESTFSAGEVERKNLVDGKMSANSETLLCLCLLAMTNMDF